MHFEIDNQFLTSVTYRETYSILANKENLTEEDLISRLMGKDQVTVTSSDDHPEFAKLRNHLEELKYIHAQRNWWNGDRVLKSFTLNGARFKEHEQFPCAAAIKLAIKHKLQSQQ